MKNFHELLGKRVQFYTVINGKLLECKGTVTAVLLSLEGKKEISLGGDYYDMDDVQQLEVLTEGAECARTDTI